MLYFQTKCECYKDYECSKESAPELTLNTSAPELTLNTSAPELTLNTSAPELTLKTTGFNKIK